MGFKNAQTRLPGNRQQQRRTKQLKWSEAKTLGCCSTHTHVYERNRSKWSWNQPSCLDAPFLHACNFTPTKVLHTHRPRNGILLTLLVANHQPVDLREAHKHFCVRSEKEDSENGERHLLRGLYLSAVDFNILSRRSCFVLVSSLPNNSRIQSLLILRTKLDRGIVCG